MREALSVCTTQGVKLGVQTNVREASGQVQVTPCVSSPPVQLLLLFYVDGLESMEDINSQRKT